MSVLCLAGTFIAILALISAIGARADDGPAAVGVGAISFTKISSIRMAAEDLYISPLRIRVRFEFANDTANDVRTVVAFPLPDIDLHHIWESESAPGIPFPNSVNFVGFKATADDKPIIFKTEQRALIGAKDVTDVAKSTGIPLSWLAIGSNGIDALPRGRLEPLVRAGAVGVSGGEYFPKWLVRTRFYWTQVFPARRHVVIEHTYQPLDGWMYSDIALQSRQFCPDTLTRVSAVFNSSAHETDYILMTAKGWRGPIGRFHLTLDKLKAWNAVSLCWNGEFRRTGLTTYEYTKENFTPTQDIRMIVLQ
jgi:hypothetical protein